MTREETLKKIVEIKAVTDVLMTDYDHYDWCLHQIEKCNADLDSTKQRIAKNEKKFCELTGVTEVLL
jgi:hypothetical protein